MVISIFASCVIRCVDRFHSSSSKTTILTDFGAKGSIWILFSPCWRCRVTSRRNGLPINPPAYRPLTVNRTASSGVSSSISRKTRAVWRFTLSGTLQVPENGVAATGLACPPPRRPQGASPYRATGFAANQPRSSNAAVSQPACFSLAVFQLSSTSTETASPFSNSTNSLPRIPAGLGRCPR